MDIPLRRFLGLYFLVTSLQFLPATVFMLGVVNSAGPNWVLPAISFTQAVITALAGLVLFRPARRTSDAPASIVAPGIPTLLQIVGVYFAVSGLVSGTRPLFRLLFSNEVWARGVGTELAAAAVGIILGGLLITRARSIASVLARYSAVSQETSQRHD